MICSKAALSCLGVQSLQCEFGQIAKIANFKYREMFLPYGNMVHLGSLTIASQTVGCQYLLEYNK